MLMEVVWILAVVAFGTLEAVTAQMVSVWFALGSIAGLVAAVLGTGVRAQLWIFALVSALALALTRPMVRRFASAPKTATNADRVIGTVGRVTEAVDAERGAVYADGKTWSARSEGGIPIPAGASVRVERIEGVKLFVTRAESV